jgi:hypothetical protein
MKHKSNKVAFVIPVHPPHYEYLNFLNSLPNDLDFDIYFVLSYREDLDILKSRNFNQIYNVILLEEKFNRDFISNIINSRIIITFKKYYAINMLKNRYEYIAAVDSEIEFVSIDNVYEKFKQYCDKKKIFGASLSKNRLEIARDIIGHPSRFFDQNIEELKNKTYGLTHYFWFSDIPIYDTKIASEFFEFINFENYEEIANKLTWWIFDYIPYIYYCVLYKGYDLINLKECGIMRNWSMESMPVETYFKINEKFSYKPLWLIHDVYNENKHQIKKDDIIMTYHRNDGRAVYL